ncbi:MAG: metal ABC transporter permease [Chloroflexota bacterium]
MIELLRDLIFDYTLRNVALGSALLGIVSGALGTFAVLRRQGLLGDALAHAALPGICLAFMITGEKTPILLMLGAAVTGWLGTLTLMYIIRHTALDEDAALGIVLSVFFGFGIVLLTLLQRSGNANQAGLDKYLFGQAATLVAENVTTMAILGTLALSVVIILYKEFKLITFDPSFAASIGFGASWVSVLLTFLIVIAIVIGLQTVGVVLMAAMLIGPAAAARQWTNRLDHMIMLSAAFGALSGVGGALVSISESGLPTGPMIILVLTLFVILSFTFGSARGLFWEWLHNRNRTLTPPPEVV